MKKTLLILIVFLLPQITAAQVYTWQDSEGKTHYSSKKDVKNAKPADLPKIMKGEAVIPEDLLKTCDDHGGIDCEAGEDEDGSVLCRDGFKDAASRFIFTCKSTQLELVSISELDVESGDYTILIRNKQGVRAKEVKVVYQLGEDNEVKVSGPTSITAFRVGEYKISGMYFITEGKDPESSKVKFACENC